MKPLVWPDDPRVDLLDRRWLGQVVDHDLGTVAQLSTTGMFGCDFGSITIRFASVKVAPLFLARETDVAKLRAQRLQIAGGRGRAAVKAEAFVNRRLHRSVGTLRQHGEDGAEARGRNHDVLALAARTLELADEARVEPRLRGQQAGACRRSWPGRFGAGLTARGHLIRQ